MQTYELDDCDDGVFSNEFVIRNCLESLISQCFFYYRFETIPNKIYNFSHAIVFCLSNFGHTTMHADSHD